MLNRIIAFSIKNKLIVGLNFLGAVGFAPGYSAEVAVLGAGIAGSMRISEDDTVRASAPITGGITLGVPFTLTLAATYAGPNNLTMNFTLSSGTNSTTVSFADTTPRTGQLFGFRDLVGTGPQSTVAFNVHYDNLSIAVPEPSVLGLLATGAVLCTRRRRSQAVHTESPLKPRWHSLLKSCAPISDTSHHFR